MSRTPSVGGVILAAVFALAVGFVIATGYMHYRLNGHLENIDFLLIPFHLAAIREHLRRSAARIIRRGFAGTSV